MPIVCLQRKPAKYHAAARGLFLGTSLCLLLALSACSTAPTSPQNTRSSAQAELQQQRFSQGRTLFLNRQYTEAATLLLPLAQQGHPGAQYSIGYLYHYGYGLPRNEKESVRWIAEAAARGHSLAQKALARINAAHDKGGVSTAPAPRP